MKDRVNKRKRIQKVKRLLKWLELFLKIGEKILKILDFFS